MNKYKFTVFTPCYNSEKIIKRLFDSLQNQSYKDFEWIVIDDVSNDNTRNIIEEFIPIANFPVKYIKNETNQMVSKNHEIALSKAEGEFFIKLSHDDTLPKNALENYLEAWNHYSEEFKIENKITGVICNCEDKNGEIEGTKFPKDFWVADDYEMRFKAEVVGEKCSATLTKVLKKYPFHYPEIDEYVPADLHFWSVSYDFNYIYSNKVGRVHIVDDGMSIHLEAQMGRGKKFLNGFSFYYKSMVNRFGKKIWESNKKYFFLFLTNYVRYSRYNNMSYVDIYKGLEYKKWLFLPAVFAGNLNELFKFKTTL